MPRADDLLARIKAEGGLWTGKRAAEALWAPDYQITRERGCRIMQQLCERGELVVANPPRGRTFKLPDASERAADGG